MAKKEANKNKNQDKKQHSKVSPIALQKCLGGVDYPAERDSLVEAAEGNGASEEVLNILERLPEQSYDSPAEVMKAFGSIGQGSEKEPSKKQKRKAG